MAADPAIIEQSLRRLLSAAPEGRLLLSRLGLLLRREIPGFTAEDYGYQSLRELVRKFPETGTLVQGRKPPELWLVAPHGQPPAVASREEIKERGRLRPEWWRAIVHFDPAYHAWLDLETSTLCEDPAVTAAQPERYLEIPRFSLEDQRKLAREFAEQQEAAVRDRLLLSLNADSWMTAFLEEADQVGAKPAWGQRRTQIIAKAAHEWVKNHDIEPGVLFEPWSSTSPRGGRNSGPVAGSEVADGPTLRMDEGAFRQFLHQIIDQMTEAELMHIPIPGRFLFRRRE
jgi:hypothetical protein